MKTIKRIFLIACILIGICNLAVFAQDETEDNFFICLGNRTLFQDRIVKFDEEYAARLNNKELYIALKSIDKKIKKAKWIPVWLAEKACIEEGEYVVKYSDTGKVYFIQNKYWIWNDQTKQFFRCNILDELRFIYDEYNKNEYAAKDVLSIE